MKLKVDSGELNPDRIIKLALEAYNDKFSELLAAYDIKHD